MDFFAWVPISYRRCKKAETDDDSQAEDAEASGCLLEAGREREKIQPQPSRGTNLTCSLTF